MPHNPKRKSPPMSKIEGPDGDLASGLLPVSDKDARCHCGQTKDATDEPLLQASSALKSSRIWQRGLAALAGHSLHQIGGAA